MDAPADVIQIDFRPARSRRLYEDVVGQVLELIAKGHLSAGSRLPVERDLAQQIGVSRNVLREAFHVLEERGIVVSRPGGGRYIREVKYSDSESSLRNIGLLEIASIEDILESREMLETETAILACTRLTSDDIPRLRAAAGKTSSWEDNMEFHATLASIARNFMLERLVRQQIELLRDVRQRDHYQAPEAALHLLREHRDIAEAVIARDARGVRRLLHRHFTHTRKCIVRQ